uniref:Transcriptional regulator n=1 Tax=Corynebacterium deserti GIMN1.010 TaxID=931089 RepID=A0A0M4CHK1_9CORY|nr:transcriptional regulator [Corynebacterium deserti GIMN1.010]
MSGLRESKKAATRTSLSRAAAQLALSEGSEGVTVVTIAAAAGVSPRTFHNYFASREDALIEFIHSQVKDLIAKLDELPDELSPSESIEKIVIDHLSTGESALDSFGALIRVCEIVEMYGHPPEMAKIELLAAPLLDFFKKKMPGVPDFELLVSIHMHAAAVATALRCIYDAPEPHDKEEAASLVRRALAMLK